MPLLTPCLHADAELWIRKDLQTTIQILVTLKEFIHQALTLVIHGGFTYPLSYFVTPEVCMVQLPSLVIPKLFTYQLTFGKT